VLSRAGVFAAVFAALFVAHQVGDHWVQTERQAKRKALPGRTGRWACARHAGTYTWTGIAFLYLTALVCDIQLASWRVFLGLGISAVTHYVADRRAPLRRLATWSGHREFYQFGAPRPGRDDNPTLGTGAYAMDQSYHHMALWVAALVIGG
jgi:Protein of unknown function (DUF3307)